MYWLWNDVTLSPRVCLEFCFMAIQFDGYHPILSISCIHSINIEFVFWLSFFGHSIYIFLRSGRHTFTSKMIPFSAIFAVYSVCWTFTFVVISSTVLTLSYHVTWHVWIIGLCSVSCSRLSYSVNFCVWCNLNLGKLRAAHLCRTLHLNCFMQI